MLRIGCHLSSSKGYMAMVKEAEKIDANTFQFFTRNPRGGSIKPINMQDIDAFNEYRHQHNFMPVLAHAPYTLNPCSADEKTREFALQAFTEDLNRMELIPNNMYNFHPGSHVKQGEDVGIRLITEMLNAALTESMTTTVLLETMAGKGTEIGRNFEQLKKIIDGVKLNDKLGVCLDTCHVYDAGYDIVNCLDDVLEEFDKTIGIKRLKAIHLNDSKNPFASHKDRHEKIGLGSLGLSAIQKILNHSQLKDLPFYLETPNDLNGYAEEIKTLRESFIG